MTLHDHTHSHTYLVMASERYQNISEGNPTQARKNTPARSTLKLILVFPAK